MNTQPISKTEDQWKQDLTPEQYAILRGKGTEAPFSGKLLHEKKDGMYTCAACGNALFDSKAKFDSGTGWPSFDEALPGSIIETEDESLGTRLLGGQVSRTEITCAQCGSHLGHVFHDGPTPTGKRYCFNSVCLDLEEKDLNKK